MDGTSGQDVLFRREGGIGRITLNRPKALNALTLGMVNAIADALAAWEADPSIRLVVLDGAGERGLCAGGDIRALHASVLARDGMAETFWRNEYALNAAIAAYPRGHVLPADYVPRERPVAEAQLRLAGDRLAALLNAALSTPGHAGRSPGERPWPSTCIPSSMPPATPSATSPSIRPAARRR